MHLELMREKARVFPDVADPEKYTSARIWFCRYRSLVPIRVFAGLRTLAIAGYPDETLEPLGELSALEELSIVDLPQVSDLSPLEGLTRLRRLELHTLPSWDASDKVTEVETLAPLTALPCLEDVALCGVRPRDGKVDDLLRCTRLRRARLSKYPQTEVERLQQTLAVQG
ncbi:MAG TPA: hypothetical protein VF053_15435 [Streptosporangiales bacterium]